MRSWEHNNRGCRCTPSMIIPPPPQPSSPPTPPTPPHHPHPHSQPGLLVSRHAHKIDKRAHKTCRHATPTSACKPARARVRTCTLQYSLVSYSLGIMGGGSEVTRGSARLVTTSVDSASHSARMSAAQASSASSWWPVAPGCTLQRSIWKGGGAGGRGRGVTDEACLWITSAPSSSPSRTCFHPLPLLPAVPNGAARRSGTAHGMHAARPHAQGPRLTCRGTRSCARWRARQLHGSRP